MPLDRYRISVTMMDSFARWKEDLIDTEELVKRLEGRSKVGPAAIVSREFHAAIENGEAADRIETEFGPLVIDDEIVIPRDPLDRVELKVVSDAVHPRARLVGKFDAQTPGNVIRDWKLTGRPEAEKFQDSYQWRGYLALAPECDTVEFYVFQLRESTRDGCWHVSNWADGPIRCERYPGVMGDVYERLGDLISTIDDLRASGELDPKRLLWNAGNP